jgi:hypothetical protein
MVEGKASQSENELSGVGAPRAGLSAQAAVQAAPKLLSVLEDFVPGSQLGVADHFPWEMVVDERANGRTRATVEALQGAVDPEVFQLISKLRVDQSHFSSFPERTERSYSVAPSSR